MGVDNDDDNSYYYGDDNSYNYDDDNSYNYGDDISHKSGLTTMLKMKIPKVLELKSRVVNHVAYDNCADDGNNRAMMTILPLMTIILYGDKYDDDDNYDYDCASDDNSHPHVVKRQGCRSCCFFTIVLMMTIVTIMANDK